MLLYGSWNYQYVIMHVHKSDQINWFVDNHITACTVVQAVVKANSQSNGNRQISTRCGSESPEWISMIPGICNYIAAMTTHANPCGAATTWVVSANTWHVTCFGFLGDLFSYFILGIAPPLMDGFWQSIRHTTCFRAKVCLSGTPLLLLPIQGVKCPKKPILGPWIGVFKPNE